MHYSSKLGLLVATGALTLMTARGIGEETGIYYESFRAGDATTDQTAGAPGSHSSLVGYQGNVLDTDYAANVAKPALDAGASLYLVLNECFSGGFIDDLAKLGGTQSVLTSARHTETASYAYEAPSGVDLDSTDTFLIGLADGKTAAASTAATAVALNPFGPNPNAKRLGESVGSEHAQYFSTGGGDQLKPAEHAQKGLAVLWAGSPAERDGSQMNQMVDRLLAMGYQADRIWLLYGGGTVLESHPLASHLSGNNPVHLQAATRENLLAIFSQAFGPQSASKPDFVFFYAGDHGGLDARSVAKPGFTPDLGVSPNFVMAPGIVVFGQTN